MTAVSDGGAATGIAANGFQRVVTYLCVASSIPEKARINPAATSARRVRLGGNTEPAVFPS